MSAHRGNGANRNTYERDVQARRSIATTLCRLNRGGGNRSLPGESPRPLRTATRCVVLVVARCVYRACTRVNARKREKTTAIRRTVFGASRVFPPCSLWPGRDVIHSSVCYAIQDATVYLSLPPALPSAPPRVPAPRPSFSLSLARSRSVAPAQCLRPLAPHQPLSPLPRRVASRRALLSLF